jgi:hypothetical protein
MTSIVDKTFFAIRDAYDWPWQRARVVEQVECIRCEFVGCSLSINAGPNRRTTVRDCVLKKCTVEGIGIDSAIIEETLVDDLRCRNTLHMGGSVLKHVTLRGNMDRLMIIPSPPLVSNRKQQEWHEANAHYYEQVDWALDITYARVKDLDLRGVPGHLVRRDTSTQALLSRHQAERGLWRYLAEDGNPWPTAIEWFLEDSPWDREVLVCPKRSPHFLRDWTALKRLRDIGVVELD